MMLLRQSVAALVGAAFLSASVGSSKAAVFPPTPAAAAPAAAAAGVGVGLAAGLAGAGVGLILVDLWLKAHGYKNWDGTPKTTKPIRHRRR